MLSLQFIVHTSYKSRTEEGVASSWGGRHTVGKASKMLDYACDFSAGFGIENDALAVITAC